MERHVHPEGALPPAPSMHDARRASVPGFARPMTPRWTGLRRTPPFATKARAR